MNSSTNLLVAAAFTPISLQPPEAWCGHLPFAAWLVRALEPQIFVELGTHSGNSYFSFCQSVKETRLPTRCYAVDTWQGDEHAGSYDDLIFNQVSAHNQSQYEAFSRLMRMTFDNALDYFGDKSVDLLHIDGLHTYEAVKHDFESWHPKLAPGAVVLFHDTNVRERNFGVWKLWEELCQKYPNHLEFLHSNGLGVIQLPGASPDKALDWLVTESSFRQQLSSYFAALGARQIERYNLAQAQSTISSLNQVIVNRDQQVIPSLNQVIVNRDQQLSRLVDLERTNAELRLLVSQAEQSTVEILGSTSWRLTAPLRWLGSLVRRQAKSKKKLTSSAN